MATPIFCCGFECGVVPTTTIGAHWDNQVASAAVSISTTTVRSGARSLRINSTGNQSVQTSGIPAATTFAVRCYVLFASLPANPMAVLSTAGGVGGPLVRFNSADSKIYAAVGTTLGASGASVTTGQWYRIDALLQITVGGNDTCTVAVDGTTLGIASATGLNNAIANISLGPAVSTGWVGDVFWDDVLLSHTAADYPLGAGYVNHFVPTADGTHNIAGTGDFQRTTTGTDILNATTTAYQLIDDVPLETTPVDWINMVAPINATDHVECVFGPAPGITAPTTGPRAVDAICGIHAAATATGNMRVQLLTASTLWATPLVDRTAVAGTTTLTYAKQHRAIGAGGGAWVIGGGGANDFTATKVRFRSPTAVDATPDQYLDCVMLEAEFAAAGGPTNYSLALDAAAVAVSVQSVAVLRGRTLALDTSALAVEPQALALSRGRTLALDAVAVAIAGQPVTLLRGRLATLAAAAVVVDVQAVALPRGRTLTLDAAAVGIDVQAVTLVRLAVSALALDAAAVVVDVQALALLRGRRLALDTAALAVSVQALALRRTAVLALDAAALAISGQTVTLGGVRRLALETASVAVSVQPVALTGARRLALESATVAVSAQSVTLLQLAASVIGLSQTTVTLSAQAVTLTWRRRVSVAIEPVAVALSGQAVWLLRGRTLALAPAAVALSGQALQGRRALVLAPEPAAVALEGRALGLRHARRLTLEGAAVASAGQPVALRRPVSILTLDAAAVALTAQPLGLYRIRQLSLALDAVAVQIDPQPLALPRGGALQLAPAAVALTVQPLTLTYVALQHYTLTLEPTGVAVALPAAELQYSGQVLGIVTIRASYAPTIYALASTAFTIRFRASDESTVPTPGSDTSVKALASTAFTIRFRASDESTVPMHGSDASIKALASTAFTIRLRASDESTAPMPGSDESIDRLRASDDRVLTLAGSTHG